MPSVRAKYRREGMSKPVIDMLLNGWRKNTKKQYQVYFKKWELFCEKNNVCPQLRNVNNIVEFLLYLFNKNFSYSAINTARSAMSCLFDEPPIGEHCIIRRFMRSVFNSRPSTPRYSKIWDVSTVLKYLEKKSPARSLSLKELTMKLVMLCALVTAQRCQTLHLLNIGDGEFNRTKVVFRVRELLKHNRPSSNNNIIVLPAYVDNRNLCVVTYINSYIKRTKPFRSDKQLFLSYVAPHKPVSKDTISRWIKITLQKSGIDTKIFKAHSTRAAASSAVQRDLDVTVIMKAAGWSNARTFATFYKKKVEGNSKMTAFGKAVLDKR